LAAQHHLRAADGSGTNGPRHRIAAPFREGLGGLFWRRELVGRDRGIRSCARSGAARAQAIAATMNPKRNVKAAHGVLPADSRAALAWRAA